MLKLSLVAPVVRRAMEKDQKNHPIIFSRSLWIGVIVALVLSISSHYFSVPYRHLLEAHEAETDQQDIFDRYANLPLIIEWLGISVSIAVGITITINGRAREIALIKEQHAKAQLAIEQERSQFAIEANKNGVWDWDIASGTVTMTDRAKEIMGITHDGNTFTRQEMQASILPNDQNLFNVAISDLLAGKSDALDQEYRILITGKEPGWGRIRGKIFATDKMGTPLRVVGTISDITSRKETELNVLSQKQELERLNSLMVNRELKMIELKNEIKKLKAQHGS